MRDEMIYTEIESMNEEIAAASFVTIFEDWEGCKGQWKLSNPDSNLVEPEVQ